MENKKIAKVEADIAKTRAKLTELQAQLKEQERQKLELENTDIVDMVRGLNISLADLPALLQSLSGGKTATSTTSGQIGPKSEPKKTETKEDTTNE